MLCVCVLCVCCVALWLAVVWRLAGCLFSPPRPPPCRPSNQKHAALRLWPTDAQYRFIFGGAYLYGRFVWRHQNTVRGAYWMTNLTKNAVRVCGFDKIGYSGCVLVGSYGKNNSGSRKK